MMEAARVALDCDDEVEEFSIAYRKRRDLMMGGLSDIPGLRIVDPEGAFYLFVDVTGTGMTDIEFMTAHSRLASINSSIPNHRWRRFRKDILCSTGSRYQRRNKKNKGLAFG